MNWLTSPGDTASSLPAAWLLATGAAPRNLDERSALRRGLGRDVLGRQLGQEVEIGHDRQGRPFIEGRPTLHISLATRGGVVAIALAEQPVGVDVEELGEAPFPTSMLHRSEARLIESLPAPAQPLAFAELWAAKEAYVKARGTGFVRAPDSFAVVLEGKRFRIEDGQQPILARGWLTGLNANGGQNRLAAAMIVLG